jgi:beta-phosphoglucomutase-like phosphatase (HAD superfamily)
MGASEVVLRDGVMRLMDEAQAANVRLAIATTTSFENIAALLAATLGPTALDRFAAIGAGDEVEHKKPAPDVYLAVLRKLDIHARHCVAIEDSVNGLRSAKAAALFTVVAPTYWTEHEDFSEADLMLPSLGSREAPLPDPIAAEIGAPWLGIAELEQKLVVRHEALRS